MPIASPPQWEMLVITGAAESEPPLDGLRHNTKYEFTWDIVMITFTNKNALKRENFHIFFLKSRTSFEISVQSWPTED
jgi:hypothetical protein